MTKAKTPSAARSRKDAGDDQLAPQRGHLTESAYAYVKERILDGRLKPGERLNLNDVVSALNASRQPVMMALRRLSAEGFVEITPQSGCRISVPDPNAIEHFFRAFAAVEGVAAEIAAEQPSAAILRQLVGINAMMLELDKQTELSAIERGDTYRRLNQDFHSGIHEMSSSNLVSSLSESFWDRADFYISSTLGASLFSTRIATSYDEHQEIISAIRDRRPADARRLMEAHIRAFAREGHS